MRTSDGNRLRDSAKWMATVIGAALATVIGTAPLAGMREHRPPAIAICLAVAGLVLLGLTLFLVMQVMRPQSVDFLRLQTARPRSWLPRSPLYKWQQTVEAQQDLYLPCGVQNLTSLRQAMIVEEVTLAALARARASARDREACHSLTQAQAARAARLHELKSAAAQVATVGEYYRLRERSTWATYGGILLGVLATGTIAAAFVWPVS